MVRGLLIQGMLAGALAGILGFLFALTIGEPRVDSAIAYEEAHSHEHGMEAVSRTMQSTGGLATGVLVYAPLIDRHRPGDYRPLRDRGRSRRKSGTVAPL